MSSQTTLDNIYQRYKKEAGDERITKLQTIQDLNDLLQRMKLTKPAEVISKIYYVDEFYKYAWPADCREPISIYADSVKVIYYVSPFRFRLEVPPCAFSDQVDAGLRYLLLRNPYSDSVKTVITDCDSLTADGAWTISGGSSLAIDTNVYEHGSGSLSFNVSGTQTILTFTKTTVIDASAYTKNMVFRCFAWLPTAPATIKIRIGNDASNYLEQTITTQAHGKAFQTTDSNELELREDQATETGTVNKSNMDWVQIELNFSVSTTDTEFGLDYLVLARPEIHELEYYTNYIAFNSSGVLIVKMTESEESTDEPIIKDYPDFIDVVVAGMSYEFLRLKNPNRAAIFESDYRGTLDKQGKPVGGIALLNNRYPNRRANYKRMMTLPPLNSGIFKSDRRYR